MPDDDEISPIDIVAMFEQQHEERRRRDRRAFALQVLAVAFALTAVIVVVLNVVLAGISNDMRTRGVPLIASALLAFLTIAAVTLFISSNEDKLPIFRGSRRQLMQELLRNWAIFESAMRRDVESGVDASSKRLELSAVISQFASRYDVDPKSIRHVLRIRNAVAHRTSRIGTRELRASLLQLRELQDLLELLGTEAA